MLGGGRSKPTFIRNYGVALNPIFGQQLPSGGIDTAVIALSKTALTTSFTPGQTRIGNLESTPDIILFPGESVELSAEDPWWLVGLPILNFSTQNPSGVPFYFSLADEDEAPVTGSLIADIITASNVMSVAQNTQPLDADLQAIKTAITNWPAGGANGAASGFMAVPSSGLSIASSTWSDIPFQFPTYGNSVTVVGSTPYTDMKLGNAGTYKIEGQVGFSPNGTGYREAAFALNGGGPLLGHAAAAVSGTAPTVVQIPEFTIALPASTTLRIKGWQNSGAALAIDSYTTWFDVTEVKA